MLLPQLPGNEKQRLEALKEYSILDTLPEKEYDDITYLASHICGTPISLISLIDDKRQWFKSHHGLEAEYTSKEVAFCAHAINDKDNIFIIPDSRKDERFHDNPLVTGEPHVIFYAGIPLVNPEGYPLGALCVIDSKPKQLSQQQINALEALSNQLMKLFELRRSNAELRNLVSDLENKNEALQKFAQTAAHDIKSPLSTIEMMLSILRKKYYQNLPEKAKTILEHINLSTSNLNQLIEGILRFSKESGIVVNNKEDVKVYELVEGVVKLVIAQQKINLTVDGDANMEVFTNKTALKQILINLISNALKYNDKETLGLNIMFVDESNVIRFNIIDNGPGIKIKDQDRIFNLFETSDNPDQNGTYGTGIGLATVKTLVEKLGGYIKIKSDTGNGADFEFTISK